VKEDADFDPAVDGSGAAPAGSVLALPLLDSESVFAVIELDRCEAGEAFRDEDQVRLEARVTSLSVVLQTGFA
jgi:hypothetical protein